MHMIIVTWNVWQDLPLLVHSKCQPGCQSTTANLYPIERGGATLSQQLLLQVDQWQANQR